MQKITILVAAVILAIGGFTQGKLLTLTLNAPSLQNSVSGENAARSVSVYLPPGYEGSGRRYPVVYFLHGIMSTNLEIVDWLRLPAMMDSAIATGRATPAIFVFPDSKTKNTGSFYTNSSYTGNWADFITSDLVQWIDKNYRTIPNRLSRGIAGHSMGGYGTIKLAMEKSDVFGVAYALSPAVLNFHADFSLSMPAFKVLSNTTDEAALLKKLHDEPYDFNAFFPVAIWALAQAWSPDALNKTLHAKLPVSYVNDSAVYHPEVIHAWQQRLPYNMVDSHLPALRNLTALKLDWGRNEDFPHIPFTALQFSKKLEMYGIKHFAEEYIGDHGNMIGGWEGRFYTELLPFFKQYLRHE